MKICILSLGEFLVHVRAASKPHLWAICLHNTNSPTTNTASFCQLQGVCPPRPLSSSSCCSQGHPAVQPGSSAGRAGSSPSTAPSGHCKPGTPRPCQASLRDGFFQTLTFKFRLITEFTYIGKNEKRSSLLSVCLRTKIAIKINKMGILKQISIMLSRRKEIRKENTLETIGIRSVDKTQYKIQRQALRVSL